MVGEIILKLFDGWFLNEFVCNVGYGTVVLHHVLIQRGFLNDWCCHCFTRSVRANPNLVFTLFSIIA